jgi:hypothetical protein
LGTSNIKSLPSITKPPLSFHFNTTSRTLLDLPTFVLKSINFIVMLPSLLEMMSNLAGLVTSVILIGDSSNHLAFIDAIALSNAAFLACSSGVGSDA